MTLPLLMPNIEAVVSGQLRATPEVAAICGNRVYTVLPNNIDFPLLLITRMGGVHEVVIPPPLWVEEAILQFDSYADTKSLARLLMDTVRSALVAMIGKVTADAVILNVLPGSVFWLPDDSYAPVKPRYIVDCTVTYRPVTGSPGP
jgi:hypothetical protein